MVVLEMADHGLDGSSASHNTCELFEIRTTAMAISKFVPADLRKPRSSH
jgi:hypothetical protein